MEKMFILTLQLIKYVAIKTSYAFTLLLDLLSFAVISTTKTTMYLSKCKADNCSEHHTCSTQPKLKEGCIQPISSSRISSVRISPEKRSRRSMYRPVARIFVWGVVLSKKWTFSYFFLSVKGGGVRGHAHATLFSTLVLLSQNIYVSSKFQTK